MTRSSTRRGLALLAVAALVWSACSDEPDAAIDGGGTSTSDTSTTVPSEPVPSETTPPTGQQPEGFTTIQALITEPDGEVCEVCLWLADDADERARGLMGVTDLGDPVGMAFRFDDARSGSFYMFQTPTPLSIAWFAPDGAHVGTADMDPCLDTPAGDCPLYSAGAEYDLAIEVFEGGLEPLGLVPGSSVVLIEGSEADGCPPDS